MHGNMNAKTERSLFFSQQRQYFFLFSKLLRLKSWAHPCWHLMDARELSTGLKRPGRVADHMTPSTAKLKMRGPIFPRPLMHSLLTQGKVYFLLLTTRIRMRAAVYSQTPYVRVTSEFSHILTNSQFTFVGTESDKP